MLSNNLHINAQVYCDGIESCRYARIENARNIQSNKTNALRDSVIISGGNAETMKIKIEGTQKSSFFIYCNTTDICKIWCLSQYACSNLTLICPNNNCFAKCDIDEYIKNNGMLNDTFTYNTSYIDCPKSGNWSYLSTDSPSSIPTDVPSYIPTANPTRIPTINPTTANDNLNSSSDLNLEVTESTIQSSAASQNGNRVFNPGFRNVLQSQIKIELSNTYLLDLFSDWYLNKNSNNNYYNNSSYSLSNITSHWNIFDSKGNLLNVPSDISITNYESDDLLLINDTYVYVFESYHVIYASQSISVFSKEICNVYNDEYFESGKNYTFKNTINIEIAFNNTRWRNFNQTSSITLIANTKPTSGNCSASRMETQSLAYPLADTYTIDCQGWIDADYNTSHNLSYNFIYNEEFFIQSDYSVESSINTLVDSSSGNKSNDIPYTSITAVILDEYSLPTCVNVTMDNVDSYDEYVEILRLSTNDFVEWVWLWYSNVTDNIISGNNSALGQVSIVTDIVYDTIVEYLTFQDDSYWDSQSQSAIAELQSVLINGYIDAIIDDISSVEEAAIVLIVLSTITTPLIDTSNNITALYNSTLIASILNAIDDPILELYEKNVYVLETTENMDSDAAQAVFGMFCIPFVK